MVLAVNIQSNDIVWEIGPGQGALTKWLTWKQVAEVVAVEKDIIFLLFLQEKIFVRNRKQKTCFNSWWYF